MNYATSVTATAHGRRVLVFLRGDGQPNTHEERLAARKLAVEGIADFLFGKGPRIDPQLHDGLAQLSVDGVRQSFDLLFYIRAPNGKLCDRLRKHIDSNEVFVAWEEPKALKQLGPGHGTSI